MLKSRVIPCLLVNNGRLIKTIKFSSAKYLGDPINAVRIFSELKADELVILDIGATSSGCGPDLDLIRKISKVARMPICYGGGINTVKHAIDIIKLGVEKIAISSHGIQTFQFISDVATEIGSQSVVGVIDVKRNVNNGNYEVFTHNGKRKYVSNAIEIAIEFQKAGAGEIVINSIDRDGTMLGYDYELASAFKKVLDIPMILLGGARSYDDIRMLTTKFKLIGASAGSLFVFNGNHDAVLINYPSPSIKDKLLSQN